MGLRKGQSGGGPAWLKGGGFGGGWPKGDGEGGGPKGGSWWAGSGGKGQGTQGPSQGPKFGVCWECGGPHYQRDCPKKNGTASVAAHSTATIAAPTQLYVAGLPRDAPAA